MLKYNIVNILYKLILTMIITNGGIFQLFSFLLLAFLYNPSFLK